MKKDTARAAASITKKPSKYLEVRRSAEGEENKSRNW